jgi:hypothetical protein
MKGAWMKLFRLLSILGVSFVLLGGGRSHAAEEPDPEALKAAKELCALVLSKESVKQISTQVSAMTWPGIEEALKSKQTVTTAQIDSLRQDFERIQIEFLSTVLEDAPPVYAHHFTAGELRQLIAFYQTPVGKKTISVLPQVMTEVMALVSARLPKVQNDVMQSFGKVLRKRGFSI